MGELVLLVVAAAWAAVLIPPLLRSRIENRPNASVTDFRRQLNKLQSTVPNRASGPMRGYARPLAQSPLQRPAAGGRPGMQGAQLRRQHGTTAVREAPRRRTHGDPSGSQPRPEEPRRSADTRRAAKPETPQQHPKHQMTSADQVRRRRSNILFLLVIATGATLFLAATTNETALLYVFAMSFLALCAYAYLLAQARQRDAGQWPNDWMQH